jgi:rhamnosyltransferase subunit B
MISSADQSSGDSQRPLAILSAPGSRGDVNPMVAIGRHLRGRGFDVVISLAQPYAHLAESAGLTPFIAIDENRFGELLGAAEVWRPLSGLRIVLGGAASEYLIPHFELIQRLKRPGRTVLVSHPLDFASRIHRDLDPDTPLVDVVLSPMMIRDPHVPPRLSPWWFEPRKPPWLMRAGYWLGDHLLLDRYLGKSINDLRRSLSLPPVRRIMDRWWWSPDTILSLYPQWFGSVAPPGDGQWHACGFPLDVNPSSLPDDSDQLADENVQSKRPIFFTPGTAHRHAKRFFAMAIEVCQSLGMPAILATSHPAQLPTHLPPTIRGVGYVPLGRVLTSCAAIVHHGGIGTTAHSIAAACPQVVLPMAFDQFHNGMRVQQLGLGKVIERPSRRSLRGALAATLKDPEKRVRCQATARKTQGRDGAEIAAERIIDCLSNHRK